MAGELERAATGLRFKMKQTAEPHHKWTRTGKATVSRPS